MNTNKLRLLIVGAGKSGASFLKLCLKCIDIQVVGVVDVDSTAPGIEVAKGLGIQTSASYVDFLKNEKVDVLLDLSGSESVGNEILKAKPINTHIIHGQTAKFFWDIFDENLRVEDLLKESFERYKDLFENVNDLIQSVNIEGKFVYVNKKWKEVLGYNDDDLRKITFEDLCRSDYVDHCRMTFKKLIEGSAGESVEVVFKAKDGHEVYLEGHLNAKFEDGEFVNTRGIFRDITENRKIKKTIEDHAYHLEQANEKLRKTMNEVQEKDQKLLNTAEELQNAKDELEIVLNEVEARRQFEVSERDRLKIILEQMGEGVLVINGSWYIELINDKAKELLGMDGSNQDVGKENEQFVLKLCKKFSTSDNLRYEKEVVLEQPCKKMIQIILAKLTTKEGGFVGIIRDVTLEKQVEQMKSDFVSNVSHELRTPMSPMREALDMMLSEQFGELNQKQKRFLEVMNNNTKRLIRLVNDLLDVSKMEAGKMELVRNEVSLDEIIDSALVSMHPSAEKKDVKLECANKCQEIKIFCDVDKITQVFLNLISNAIKFTPSGGTVVVECDKHLAGIEFGIKDSGPGLSKDEIKVIFDKYKQMATPQAKKGTGLGLAISKSIIELHGGRMWVESTKGKGSNFKFVLPIGNEDESKN